MPTNPRFWALFLVVSLATYRGYVAGGWRSAIACGIISLAVVGLVALLMGWRFHHLNPWYKDHSSATNPLNQHFVKR